MSRSEFRWNKKRKHYSYLFKDVGQQKMNLLIFVNIENILVFNNKKARPIVSSLASF